MRTVLIYISSILLSVLSLVANGKAPFDPSAKNIKITGDSVHRFKTVPWKCIVTHESTGAYSTRYYDRNGQEKARVANNYFCARHQGPSNRDYYETYRTNKKGETKLTRNWYNYGVDFNSKPNNTEYFYTPRYNDRHGNWIYAKNSWRNEAVSRQLFYYDEPEYDAREDSLINSRINELVNAVEEQENPFNPTNILTNVFGLCAKLIYIFGLFVLFMLTFKRQKLYLWFDCRATRKITPYGNRLFNKTSLYGVIPTLIFYAPIGIYVYNGHSTAILPMSLISQTAIALAISILYCLIFIAIRSRYSSARCAKWELIYSICLWICIWAAAILAIYILVITLIALIFIGMIFGKGSTAQSDNAAPDQMYATSSNGDTQYLTHLSNGYYQDTHGNLYHSHGGSISRLSDGTPYF